MLLPISPAITSETPFSANIYATEKPAPNSTPLTAGMEKNELPKADSSEPKMGLPRPAGTLNA